MSVLVRMPPSPLALVPNGAIVLKQRNRHALASIRCQYWGGNEIRDAAGVEYSSRLGNGRLGGLKERRKLMHRTPLKVNLAPRNTSRGTIA